MQVKQTGISGVGQRDTAKGPIFTVQTTDGGEYSTFNGALANQARQLVGQNVQLRFNEKHVEKNGQTYVNRYYEGAEPSGGLMTTGDDPMQQLSFGNVPASGQPIPRPDERTKQIHRQTASKVAAQMLGYLPEGERTPDGLVAIAEYLVSYYEDGPRRAAPNGQPSYFEPVPQADDIPF